MPPKGHTHLGQTMVKRNCRLQMCESVCTQATMTFLETAVTVTNSFQLAATLPQFCIQVYINHPDPGTPRNSLPSDSFVCDHGWILPQGKHRLPSRQRHKCHSFFGFVLFLSSPKDMCIAFRAEEGREGNISLREKHQLVATCMSWDQGMYLQPRYVPRPGTEPTTTVATPARAKWQHYV